MKINVVFILKTVAFSTGRFILLKINTKNSNNADYNKRGKGYLKLKARFNL